MRVSRGGQWVSFALRDASGAGTAEGSAVTYPGALEGVDVRYTAESGGLKEDLVLSGPESVRSFAFDVAASPNVSVRALAGALQLEGGESGKAWKLAQPFLVDAAGETSGAVRVAFRRAESGWTLELAADDAWLDDPKRAWPVTLDPTLEEEADRDCYIENASGNLSTSFCAGTRLEVGYGSGSGALHDNRALMHFPVQQVLPPDVDILSSSLGLWLDNQSTTTEKRIAAHRVQQSWTSAVSWNRRDSVNAWATPGGDFASTPESTTSVGGTGAENRYHYWNLRSLTQDWLNGNLANEGVLLKDADSGVSNRLQFNSSEQTGTSSFLEVIYEYAVGERRAWTQESFGLSDRMQLSVNSYSGNLMLRHTDLTVPGGLGPDVQVGRTYNSLGDQSDSKPDYGFRWDMDTGQDIGLRKARNGDLMFHGPSGYAVRFADTGSAFRTPPGFDSTLVKQDDGTYKLTQHQSQTVHHFNADGRLQRIEDRNGRSVRFAYQSETSPYWRVKEITDSQERVTQVFYSADGQISRMVDPAGREYLYTQYYDATQQRWYLTSYTDPAGGVTRYEYGGPDGRLSKITTPAGRVTTVAYFPDGDPNEYRVRSITRVTASTGTGPTTAFSYGIRQSGAATNEVTDANGRKTTYRFDDRGRADEVTDALGRKTKNSYTTNDNVETYTAPTNTGAAPNTTLQYDGNGNLQGSKTTAGSGMLETRTSYTAGGTVKGGAYLPTLVQNAQDTASGSTTRGTQISYANAEGNPTLIKSSESSTGINFNYAAGPDGKPGKLASSRDPNGNLTRYAYDTKGNLTEIDHPNTSTNKEIVGTERLSYGAQGSPDEVLSRINRYTDGRGNTISYEYDALDRVVLMIARYPSADGTQMFEEARHTFSYDLDGNLLQGNGSTYTYDALGRIATQAFNSSAVTTSYGYDGVGNLKSLTDGGGTVTYGHDAINRMTSIQEPGVSSPISVDYRDTTGDNDSTTDDNGLKQTWTFPNSMRTTKLFDNADRLQRLETRNTLGTVLQRFAYDYKRTTPSGPKETAMIDNIVDHTGRTIFYDYNQLDRLTAASQGSRSMPTDKWTYLHDNVGNVLRRGREGSATTHYGYNAANQVCWSHTGTVSGTPDCDNPPTGATQFSYDKAGNETSGLGRTTHYNARNQSGTRGYVGMSFAGPGQDQRYQSSAYTLSRDIFGISRTHNYGHDRDLTRTDQGTIVGERDPQGASPDRRRYRISDHLGSTVALADENADIDVRYRYDPYGRELDTGSWAGFSDFGYAGGYRDIDDVYHFGQRFYDPEIGRWTQLDPLSQTSNLRQNSRYLYVGGNPANFVDPTGTHYAGRGASNQESCSQSHRGGYGTGGTPAAGCSRSYPPSSSRRELTAGEVVCSVVGGAAGAAVGLAGGGVGATTGAGIGAGIACSALD